MIKKLDKPISYYFDLTIRSPVVVEKLHAIQAISFVRGEIEALTWVRSCSSLTKTDIVHIDNRINDLNKFLNGESASDFDPSEKRPVADFAGGEKN